MSSAQENAARGHYELVRVSRQLVEEMLAQVESPPVVLVGLERHEDGTCELIFRRADNVPS